MISTRLVTDYRYTPVFKLTIVLVPSTVNQVVIDSAFLTQFLLELRLTI